MNPTLGSQHSALLKSKPEYTEIPQVFPGNCQTLKFALIGYYMVNRNWWFCIFQLFTAYYTETIMDVSIY